VKPAASSARPAVALRAFAPADAEAALRVLLADEDFAVASTGYLPAAGDLQSLFYALPEGASPDVKQILVAVADDEIVGVVDALLGWPASETVTVGLFLIHPRCRRTGIGSRVLGMGVDRMRAGGFRQVRAGCPRGWEPGERFLAGHGFAPAAAREPVAMNRVIHPHEAEHPAAAILRQIIWCPRRAAPRGVEVWA